MGCTIQEVFKRHFAGYRLRHKLPEHHARAAYKMMACRTAKLGGHKQVCPNGHIERIWYNSCKHRSCPQCNGLQMERWLQRQRARMLDCPHYHVIFTVPHEYNLLWLYNSSEIMRLLFQAAKDSMMEFISDPKYLGAEPGMMGCFHSWGRDQNIHPHAHFLLTAGGLNKEGKWVEQKRSHLLPTKPLMLVFQGKFNAYLRKALTELNLPPGLDERHWHNTINKLGRRKKKWNVKIQDRYDHGEGVAKYLARYIRGGPFNNGQLIEVTASHVRFRYYDHRHNAQGKKNNPSYTNFTPDEFIRRCLAHVPETRRQTSRHYGLYSPRKKEALDQARAKLGQQPVPKEKKEIDWKTYLQNLIDKGRENKEDKTRCPKCKALLIQTGELPPTHDPPKESDRNPPRLLPIVAAL